MKKTRKKIGRFRVKTEKGRLFWVSVYQDYIDNAAGQRRLTIPDYSLIEIIEAGKKWKFAQTHKVFGKFEDIIVTKI